MTRALRIAIAEDEPELLADLEETLVDLGHDVVGKASPGEQLVEVCRQIEPDLVIADIKMPGMDGLQERKALHQQADDLRQALEDRKLIERAKGILMKRTGLSEPDAFRRLQLLSSQKNVKMIEIAQTLVAADEAFDV